MKYEERVRLQELSVKAFGNKSAWNKLYKRGHTANLVETLPDGTERKYRGSKYQTLEELEITMHELIAQKEKECQKLKKY